MDTDETLDWGAHDDDESAQLHSQASSGKVRHPSIATKDEATLSGAESLLALASGGVDAQDDKDSDVVSLGGGDDDMEELYAYQSRTHLGGVASGDSKSDEPSQSHPTEEAKSEDEKPEKTLAASTSPTVIKKPQQPSNELVSDSSKSHSKPDCQPNALTGDHARSPSTTKLVPPTGPLGLPPKPVAAPTTPYIRPSHPSIMSASSMAAPARERDHHDTMKGKHGPHRHASPENDSLLLAPGWETRRARDGTQDMYYYNTKTHQSTWSRSIATGMSTARQEGSASPTYARGRVKEQFQSSRKPSPVARDMTHLADHDSEPLPRTRSTRFDTIRPEPTASSNGPVLSFEERHYRPNDSRSPDRTPPYGNGDPRAQSQARGTSGPLLTHRDNPPANLPTHHNLRHGSDRDLQAVNLVHSRDRDGRELPPFVDRALGRNGERRVERSRSRSPGRGRSRHVWPNELVSNSWVRDDAVSTSNDRPVPAILGDPRPPYGGSPPPSLYRGAPQTARPGPLGREDRSRYAPPPNHDQSSSRDRHRSPPPPERPRKRTRSVSPIFDNVNPRQAFRQPQTQRSRHNSRWNEFDATQARQRDQTPHFDGQVRDRPPHQLTDPPNLLPSVSYTDKVRNGVSDRDRAGGRDLDREADTKRRKIFDNSDSMEARQPRSDSHGDRDTGIGDAPRRKRQPLPPQSERFKEMAIAPTAPPPPSHNIPNSPLPSATPSGPRRLPIREANLPDSVQQARGRPSNQMNDFEDPRRPINNNLQIRQFEMNDNFGEGQRHEERNRQRRWDHEKERPFPAELPTGPRAMDLDSEPPRFIRRARSPPPLRQHRTDRSPPHFATNGPHKSDRRDHLASGGFRHGFDADDRAHREHDRQSGIRVGENQEFGYPRSSGPDSLSYNPRSQHQQLNRPEFNSKVSGADNISPVTRKSGTGEGFPGESFSASLSNLPTGSESRKSPLGDEPWVTRVSKHSTLPRNVEERRRASLSGAPSPDMRSENIPPPGLRAPVSPPNEPSALPGNPRRPRPRVQSSYPSRSYPSLDRPLPPEGKDTPAVRDSRDFGVSHPPTGTQEALSDRPKNERYIESPSHSHSANVPLSNSRQSYQEHVGLEARSVVEPSVDTNKDGSRREELSTSREDVAQHGQANEGAETQSSGPGDSTGIDSERSQSLSFMARPSSPPPGARAIRIRRPSKLPDPPSSVESRDAAGQGQLNRPPRQGSLLDRLSTPSHTPGVTPPLRDRVGFHGENWKRGGTAPQLTSSTSLRDRLEDIGDAHHPVNLEWEQSYEDASIGNRRDRQFRRDRSRRGGKGQREG